MKKIRLNYLLLTGVLIAGLYSCTKTADDFDPQGGLLPSHYVDIKDNSFSPAVLSIANGSSITFLNKTTSNHTLVSDDSSTILSPAIPPNSFYFVKPDTLAGSATIYLNYHCKEHPAVTGTIILTP
jgi:plastocyanin